MRLRATHVDTVNSRQQVAVLEEAEALTAKWQPRAAGSFMSAQAGSIARLEVGGSQLGGVLPYRMCIYIYIYMWMV